MQAILDLKTHTAREILLREKSVNPQNGYTIYLEHYCESIELIVNEDEKIYEKLINSYEERMEQMDLLDDGSPYNAWLQAEMLFHTGLAQIKYGTRISGVLKMLSSYNRIKELRQKFPQFWQNLKLVGTYNIILDFIPPYMRWATDIFGFRGDSEAGIRQLREYCEIAKNFPGLAEEGILFTNLGYMLTWREEECFKFMTGLDKELTDLTLVKYLYANTASFTYRDDLTLQLLGEIQQDELQVKFYPLFYKTGRSKLNHLEKDALVYLEAFMKDYPGPDYKKDVCNRISYYYLIWGDLQKYEEYRAKVATVGQDLRERDREAVVESRSGLIPHTGLLKARLLCDGGYFQQADSVIKSIDPDLLSHTAYQLEYHYRKGRICQLTGKADLAIDEYNKAFYQGRSQPYTFATRSALQLGKIYEELKNYPLALQWYENCLETYNSTHTADGVEQMAEKGRDRIKIGFED
jgi:tetratricopeptide (TPR) repeat protein